MNKKALVLENPEAAPSQLPKATLQKPFLMDPTPNREALPPHREVFSQSFLQLSGLDRRRRRRSAVTSIVVEGIVIGFLVLLPFLTLDVLPTQHLAAFLTVPPPPPPPPPPAAASPKISKIVSQVLNGQLLAPSTIPRRVKMIEEEERPPAASFGVAGGVVGGVPGGQANGVLGSLLNGTHSVPAPVVAFPKRIAISTGVSDSLMLERVEPEYPILARRAHVQGTVQLKAIISKEGIIENLQLMNGHPLLVPSAMEAVRHWRYRPYTLNGNPVEVETLINVHFRLDA